jgi:hypothetical protein
MPCPTPATLSYDTYCGDRIERPVVIGASFSIPDKDDPRCLIKEVSAYLYCVNDTAVPGCRASFHDKEWWIVKMKYWEMADWSHITLRRAELAACKTTVDILELAEAEECDGERTTSVVHNNVGASWHLMEIAKAERNESIFNDRRYEFCFDAVPSLGHEHIIQAGANIYKVDKTTQAGDESHLTIVEAVEVPWPRA